MSLVLNNIAVSVTTLGNFSKSVAAIIQPKLPTLFGNFCKCVKIFHFLVQSFLGNFYRHWVTFIDIGQLLYTFGDFLLVTLIAVFNCRFFSFAEIHHRQRGGRLPPGRLSLSKVEPVPRKILLLDALIIVKPLFLFF